MLNGCFSGVTWEKLSIGIETEDTEGVNVCNGIDEEGAILGFSVGVNIDGTVNGDKDGLEDIDVGTAVRVWVGNEVERPALGVGERVTINTGASDDDDDDGGELNVGIAVGTALGIDVGTALGIDVGTALGIDVGTALGIDVGTALGIDVGTAIGIDVGTALGIDVGTALGIDVGTALGFDVGIALGIDVGTALGILVGTALKVGAVNIKMYRVVIIRNHVTSLRNDIISIINNSTD